MTNEYGRLMLDIDGKSLSEEDKNIIYSSPVGGIIFFSKNFESFEQIKNLINEIKNIKENIIFAVDHEGGRVQRFDSEFTKIPSMQEISNFARNNNDSSIFKDIGWLASSELVAVGIDINFAPVLDINKNNSTVIGDRSFSNKKFEVLEYASNYIDGMHEAGMKSTGKHFPGHGGVLGDSHIELPIDDRSLYELHMNDMLPYRDLGNKLHAVMCAHIVYSKIDDEIPSFSERWLKDILRDDLDYKGLVFSDDLTMSGAGDDLCWKKVEKSLKAGCDMTLICNDRKGAKESIDYMNYTGVEGSEEISILKSNKKLEWHEIEISSRAKEIKRTIKEIGDKNEKNSNRA